MSSYSYEDMRDEVFTDQGQRTFLKIRDHVQKTLDVAGAVRMLEAIASSTGGSYLLLACVDRMAELGEIVEVTRPDGLYVPGQSRLFVRGCGE